MIDLALRLSEQEASIVAVRRQKEEEEAMKKAIQESVSAVGWMERWTFGLSVCVTSVTEKLPARFNHEREPIQGPPPCPLLRHEIRPCFLSRCASRISGVLLHKVRACWMKRMLPPSSALAGSSRTQMEGRARSLRRRQAAPRRRSRNEVKARNFCWDFPDARPPGIQRGALFS